MQAGNDVTVHVPDDEHVVESDAADSYPGSHVWVQTVPMAELHVAVTALAGAAGTGPQNEASSEHTIAEPDQVCDDKQVRDVEPVCV